MPPSRFSCPFMIPLFVLICKHSSGLYVYNYSYSYKIYLQVIIKIIAAIFYFSDCSTGVLAVHIIKYNNHITTFNNKPPEYESPPSEENSKTIEI